MKRKAYEGTGEDLAYFMTHTLQQILPVIFQDEITYCKQVIDSLEETNDIDKSCEDMEKYVEEKLEKDETGDCFVMCSAVLKNLKIEAEKRISGSGDITKQTTTFDKDIFYLCHSQIKDSSEDHVAICARFKNPKYKGDEGYVLLDVGLFVSRAQIIRINKFEESFLGGFHTQQLLTPDNSTIISIRTNQQNESKISFYYPEKVLDTGDCIKLMKKGIRTQKTFKFKSQSKK
eukprot:gene6619-10785_t